MFEASDNYSICFLAGTCVHIGDPCTDSYRDCDAGLICDKDRNGENYCKKPMIGKPTSLTFILIELEIL